MDFRFLPILTLLISLVAVASHADQSPEAYWNTMLPNTPMPKAVKDLLPTGTQVGVKEKDIYVRVRPWYYPEPYLYYYAANQDQLHDDPNVALFFLEKDMIKGTEMDLHFTKATDESATFLPRKDAEKIPFSSEKFPEILAYYSLSPKSTEAKIMKKSIEECEVAGIKGEDKYCATSLESMVDFSTSKLGKKVKAISTEAEKKNGEMEKYRVEGVKKVEGGSEAKAVVCHKQKYPYAVFYCHKTDTAKPYVVSLRGSDGAKVEAVAVCHTDTSAWNPKHLAFQVLKVKPGTVPVCHFLPEDHIVWVPTN